MIDDILFYGDPHGDFAPLLHAVQQRRPEAVVLLGDYDVDVPLERALAPVLEAVDGAVWWIPGNHDSDRPERCQNVLFSKLADRNLHGRVEEIAGVRVAGLGGVFRGQVWYPRDPEAAPRFRRRADYLATLPRCQHWHGGVPLKHRTTIFPEDVEALAGQRCDVLVTHEAPETLEFGFSALGDLGRAMGAAAVVHGHHHVDYRAEADGGLVVVGCGLRQPKWGRALGLDLDRTEAPAPR